MTEILFDTAYPTRTLVLNLILLTVGITFMKITLGEKWKQWGVNWSWPVRGFGFFATLTGGLHTILALKFLGVFGAA